MSRTPIPLCVGDVSALAKTLRKQLDEQQRTPGHVEMLNLLARSGGYRNFQHLKAQTEARATVGQPVPVPAEVDFRMVKRLVRFFDEQGRLIRWPGKFSQRLIALWVLWSRIPARTRLTEKAVNELLENCHCFGDHALLRREMVDQGMVERTADGRSYQRLERKPPPEAVEIIQRITA